MPASQHLAILTTMALCRCHEADAAMPVLVVVPADKIPAPAAGRLQVGKALLRPLRTVFQRAEQRFRVRVVVAHPRAAVRRCNAQVVHLLQHGRRLHRCAVVRVQYRRGEQAPLTEHIALQQPRAQLTALLLVDLPVHRLTAVDILDQVQVEILSSYRCRQMGAVASGSRYCARPGCPPPRRWLCP